MTTKDEDAFLPASQVWKRYGISDMSLHRWIRDERLNFPAPTYVTRYRYWRLSELEQWERSLPKGAPSKTREVA